MICKRTVPALTRCMLIALAIAVLTVEFASAEGLFPSMNQMFGTAMPSIGVALSRSADETGESTDGKYELYNAFSYDDYTAFGAYLAGVGAELKSTDVTDSAIMADLTVNGTSMQFAYDWEAQTAKVIYPSGTRPETEKASVETKASILPPSLTDTIGKPMPSLGEALSRYPDEEIPGADGSNTEIFQGVTETDFNTFSVYLSEKGAALADYQAAGTTFSASIVVDGKTISFTYDTQTLEASVTYPKGTYDEWLDYAKKQFESAVQLLGAGKTDEGMSVLFTIPGYSKYKPAAEYLAAYVAAREAKLAPFRTVGGYVTFGSYEQDNSTGNGQELIEWLVLDYDAANHRVLLLSRYGLDAKPYNEKYGDITWEKCTLRIWLNGTFLNKAFTAAEQKGILLTNVDNGSSQGYSNWSTSGGNNTEDRVFLLSYAEANKYLGVTRDDSKNTKSRVAPTAYAIKQGADTYSRYKTADGTAAGWWWLRSPGSSQHNAASVDYDGSLNRNNVNYDGGCVRPALWINLESDIF